MANVMSFVSPCLHLVQLILTFGLRFSFKLWSVLTKTLHTYRLCYPHHLACVLFRLCHRGRIANCICKLSFETNIMEDNVSNVLHYNNVAMSNLTSDIKYLFPYWHCIFQKFMATELWSIMVMQCQSSANLMTHWHEKIIRRLCIPLLATCGGWSFWVG